MFSSGSRLMMLDLVLVLFVSSIPLQQIAEKNQFFVVPSNQGIFASSESLVEVKEKAKSITPAEILKKTGRDGSTLLENAWARVSQGDHVMHISLLLKFADEKCERMEFYPTNGPKDVLGEHPTGRVVLSPDTASAACADAVSFLGIPTSGGVSGLASLIQFAEFAKTGFAKTDGDFLRWKKADEKIHRRQVYTAFIDEAARFKDEKKYGCASFVLKVIEDVSNRQYMEQPMMISLIDAASKLGMRGSGPSCKAGTYGCHCIGGGC